VIDGEDFYLDLLFYHRILRRLVAVEPKLGKFQAGDKGQIEFYLRWLEKHEMQPGEERPLAICCLLLLIAEFPAKINVYRFCRVSPVIDICLDLKALKQVEYFVQAPTWQANMFREFFCTSYNPWLVVG
jgi:hypothetical protein